MDSPELQAALKALADSFDTIELLQKTLRRSLSVEKEQDLVRFVQDAQKVMGASNSALKLGRIWMNSVPQWLQDLPKPQRTQYKLPNVAQSVLAVPFKGGWMVFWGKAEGFTSEDALTASTIGSVLQQNLNALKNRHRLTTAHIESRERETASQLWRQIVPENLTFPEDYQGTLVSRTAQDVGGDFHLTVGPWIALGDISGKGISAALLTGMMVSALKVAVRQPDPGVALEDALHGILENLSMFATLILVRLSRDGTYSYLNFGHPPVLVIRNGEVAARWKATAPPLGTFAFGSYVMQSGKLKPGDMLCFYTDGVTEAEDHSGSMFGQGQLEQLLRKSPHPDLARKSVLSALKSYTVNDDLSMVFLQYQPGESQKFEMEADTRHLADLSAFLESQCQKAVNPILVNVAVTELVVNAIRHSEADRISIEVQDRNDDYLISVLHDGHTFDPTSAPELTEGELREGGYGLIIVRKAASSIQYTRNQGWNFTQLTFPKGAHP